MSAMLKDLDAAGLVTHEPCVQVGETVQVVGGGIAAAMRIELS